MSLDRAQGSPDRSYADPRIGSDSDQSGGGRPAARVCSQSGILLGAISDQSSHCAIRGQRHALGPEGALTHAFLLYGTNHDRSSIYSDAFLQQKLLSEL